MSKDAQLFINMHEHIWQLLAMSLDKQWFFFKECGSQINLLIMFAFTYNDNNLDMNFPRGWPKISPWKHFHTIFKPKSIVWFIPCVKVCVEFSGSVKEMWCGWGGDFSYFTLSRQCSSLNSRAFTLKSTFPGALVEQAARSPGRGGWARDSPTVKVKLTDPAVMVSVLLGSLFQTANLTV